MTIDLAIVALSIVGFLISSYFTAIAYRWVRPDERWIPAFCRMGEQTCASIVFSPRARVFGLPHSVLGQVYYASLIGGAALDLLERGEFYTLFLAASTLTVLLAIYLTYSLLFITRVPCTLCLTSHAINFTIFLLLLALGEQVLRPVAVAARVLTSRVWLGVVAAGMEVGDEALAVVIVEILGRSAEYGVLAIPLVGAAYVHLWWLPKHGVNGWTGEPRDRYSALVTRARR